MLELNPKFYLGYKVSQSSYRPLTSCHRVPSSMIGFGRERRADWWQLKEVQVSRAVNSSSERRYKHASDWVKARCGLRVDISTLDNIPDHQ